MSDIAVLAAGFVFILAITLGLVWGTSDDDDEWPGGVA